MFISIDLKIKVYGSPYFRVYEVFKLHLFLITNTIEAHCENSANKETLRNKI